MNTVVAPAKLTLTLEVTGVRPDGFHELRSEMVALSLSDELAFTDGSEGLMVIAEAGTRSESLPQEDDNLVAQALRAVSRKARVRVTKRIPLGGGLGGGSTDAAAVLRWAGSDDLDLALSLGSDVPFCVGGGRALVEGVGERLTPLPYEKRGFWLLVPPFGVNTQQVYAAWDALSPDAQHLGPNELAAAALVVEPRLAKWRDALATHSGGVPALAGSGSTWFVERDLHAPDIGARTITVGKAEGQLISVITVPTGWDGQI
ncbi:MAG TPA: 4-(cytidine 5'-diphospho)-2-C-methyl-D-erythritol kinase [Acidimicrobiales bacterium]